MLLFGVYYVSCGLIKKYVEWWRGDVGIKPRLRGKYLYFERSGSFEILSSLVIEYMVEVDL